MFIKEYFKVMIPFENYLLEKGYIAYSKQWINNKWEYLPPVNISSTMSGGICTHYIKDNVQIVIGLNEKDKPITLCNPRPSIIIERKLDCLTEWNDDAMNIVLSKIDFDTIYRAMFDKNETIKIDLKND